MGTFGAIIVFDSLRKDFSGWWVAWNPTTETDPFPTSVKRNAFIFDTVAVAQEMLGKMWPKFRKSYGSDLIDYDSGRVEELVGTRAS